MESHVYLFGTDRASLNSRESLFLASDLTIGLVDSADSALALTYLRSVANLCEGEHAISPSVAKRTVRLVGIDTPEVYPKLECGGKKATASLRSLLPKGTRVKLTSDPTQTRNDQYGRLLRYVTKVSTGVDMNRKQVWRGWARLFVWNDDPFMRVASYRKARQSAEAHDRGIWGLCG